MEKSSENNKVSEQGTNSSVNPIRLSPTAKQRIFHDEINYYIGVVNLTISAWLVGAFPWSYWVYHCIKLILLMSLRFYRFSNQKLQFWLLEYCYVINYLLIAYYIASLTHLCPDWIHRILFRAFFTSCIGPLALSVVVFRNSLVFHSSNNIIILAVHWSPNVALYGMRWWPNQLHQTFPNLFPIDCQYSHESNASLGRFLVYSNPSTCHATFYELYVIPVLVYIFIWAIPYYIFFFIVGKNTLQKLGYYTMVDDMVKSPFIRKIVFFGGESYQGVKYMFLHGIACCIVFLYGPLLWNSFLLHSLYLGIIISIAAFNGGTYYFQVFAKKYYQSLLEYPVSIPLETKDRSE